MTRGPGIYRGVSFEEYCGTEGINQSTIKAFGNARSPAHYLYDKAHPKELTASLRIGRYVDTAIFGPTEKEFAVWDGDRRGEAWKAFAEAAAGKTILTRPEHERASGCLLALKNHEDTQRLIAACDKQVMVVADHPEIGCRMKGLIDLLPKENAIESLKEWSFDLKTADDASQEGFAGAVYDYGYDIQGVTYGYLLELNGWPTSQWGWIVVENKPPYAVAIHRINRNSEEFIQARKRFDEYLRAFWECSTTNNWPGYGSDWTEIKFKPWQLRDSNI